jgi:hypothetical protein
MQVEDGGIGAALGLDEGIAEAVQKVVLRRSVGPDRQARRMLKTIIRRSSSPWT